MLPINASNGGRGVHSKSDGWPGPTSPHTSWPAPWILWGSLTFTVSLHLLNVIFKCPPGHLSVLQPPPGPPGQMSTP